MESSFGVLLIKIPLRSEEFGAESCGLALQASRFLDDRIILQRQLVTLQPVDLQRLTVPFWKDINLLNKYNFNLED